MKEVDDLVERTKLTDEEIVKILGVHGYTVEEAEDILNNVGRAIAQAQQDKMLKDPDLALIDRDNKLSELMFIEGYGYLQAHSAQALLNKSGCKPVIPLAEALKGER